MTIHIGEIRRFNGKKAIAVSIGVFKEQRPAQKYAHIHITGKAFHTTVTDDPDSKRFHPRLFSALRELLVASGKWPEKETA